MPGDGGFAASVIDRYRVEHELGRGGWGIVFAAHDIRLDRRVAIKLLREEYAGSVSVERFRREIGILSRLDHPNIVSLFDAGQFRDTPWYAMSLVQGETLRDRLERENQLSIPESLRIARAVAEALAHAHAASVVHRDIKPANILLSEDRVRVADFGVARALSTASLPQFATSTGVQIGTPAYMSPEQASGDGTVDRRSDIYSLGCVLYEMLAGEPPFLGASSSTVIARHVLDPVPSLRTVRQSVSVKLEDAVYRMLAKSPADRFQSASDLIVALDAAALEPEVSVSRERRAPARGRGRRAAGLTIAIAGVGAWMAWSAITKSGEEQLLALADTTQLAILPIEADRGGVQLEQLIRSEAARWTGLRLVDRSALPNPDSSARSSLSASHARSLALQVHAGRFLRGRVTAEGSSNRASLTLFDVKDINTPIAESSIELVNSAPETRASIRMALARMLTRSRDSLRLADGARATSSLTALQSFLRGRAAIDAWDLEAADSSFVAATRSDPSFSTASLWLALSRLWLQRDTATWRFAAAQGIAGTDRMNANDRARASALGQLTSGKRPEACRSWDDATTRTPSDFVAWYAAADCLMQDRLVVNDPGSPTGWSFRSGYHSALRRYRKAVELNPAILRSLRQDAFQGARQMLRTSGVNLRRGISDDRPARNFAAFPSWDGDTLQFAPLPIEAFGAQDPAVLRQFPRTVASAVLHQRELFRDIATGWAASDPRSADAAEAVAISLMLLGEVSAIDTLSHARRLATTATERQRVMAAEVFLRLQVGAPGNLKEVQRAKSVADSLLTDTSKSAADPHMLASIAALTGRAFRTLAIERAIPAKYWEPSTALVRGNSTQLTLLAAFGGPRDSLRLIERRIDSLIHALVPQPRQQATRSDALSRAVTMAFPAERLSSLHEISRPQSSLLFAEASLAGGDTDATRAVLGKIQDSRSAFALPEVTMDAVFPEAYLIDATGNPELASRWLDSRLSRLSVASSLVEPIQAAMLVRAMAFRAELAHRMGDQATAARWAGVVAALWADADPFLQPVVIRMQELLQAGKSGRTTSRSSTIP